MNDSVCSLVTAQFQVEKFMESECFEAFRPVTTAEASRLVCVLNGFRYYPDGRKDAGFGVKETHE